MLAKPYRKNAIDGGVPVRSTHDVKFYGSLVFFSFCGTRMHIHIDGLEIETKERLDAFYDVVRPCTCGAKENK